MTWKICAFAASAFLSGHVGCAADRSNPQTTAIVDAGPRTGDTPVLDAGRDSLATDAGAEVDAGRPPSCGTTGTFTSAAISVPFATPAGYALMPTTASQGFSLAYRLDPGCDQVLTASLSTAGPLTSPTVAMDDTGCASLRDIALLPQKNGNSWLAFTDNSEGSAELFAVTLDPQLQATGNRLRISENTALEHSPALIGSNGAPLLAFLQTDGVGTRIVTRLLKTEGATNHVVVPATMAHRPQSLALSPLDQTETEANTEANTLRGWTTAAVGWVDEGGPAQSGHTGVFIQPLAANGSAQGGILRLSPLAGPGATLDLAPLAPNANPAQGGAAVYSIHVGGKGQEVRFQRLTPLGSRRDDERKLLSAPLLSRDASITALGSGYAVAYRALPDSAIIGRPQIRLLFLTAEGAFSRDSLGRPISHYLADATSAVSRVTVRSSADGHLAVSWLDDTPSGIEYRLNLLLLRLDCL